MDDRADLLSITVYLRPDIDASIFGQSGDYTVILMHRIDKLNSTKLLDYNLPIRVRIKV